MPVYPVTMCNSEAAMVAPISSCIVAENRCRDERKRGCDEKGAMKGERGVCRRACTEHQGNVGAALFFSHEIQHRC